jgi:hypothetical protein
VPPEDECQRWITDARVHGFPAVATGVVLFWVVLGWPLMITLLVLEALTLPLLVWAARQAFFLAQPGD